MIKELYVEINGHRTNVDHLKSLGYTVEFRKPCKVKVEHLMPGSLVKVTAICDACGVESPQAYRDYFESTDGHKSNYYCKKCNHIKRKQTCLTKWGVENPMQVNSVKSKLKQTLQEVYGVEHYSKTSEFKQKYKQTCLNNWSVDNAAKSEIVKEKIRQSNLENLGVEYAQQNDSVKAKSTETFMANWGVNRYSQTQKFKDKLKEISLEKWGVDNYSKTEEYKAKYQETSLKKWGVDHYSKTEQFKNTVKKHRENLTKLKYSNLLGDEYNTIKYNDFEFEIFHKKCRNKFNINKDNLYTRLNANVCVCTNCYPIDSSTSNMELEMQDFLNSLGVSYNIKDKKILQGKELDIFIPDHNLAIEMNGLYWHSEIYLEKNYHINKTRKCNESNIQLLHVWEDDWKYKRQIIKSIILNKLGKLPNKIYARKCQISEVSPTEAVSFLNANHIQGTSPSQKRVGLLYDGELVGLMTFGFRYTNGKKEYELIRFCNKLNHNVIGGASKLFNHFISNNQDVQEIISYSDLSLFSGKLYEMLGFKHKRTSEPNYFWVVDGVRKHRFNFNKKRLISLGHDPSKTEVEILHELGHYRIFSCGQEKWIFSD